MFLTHGDVLWISTELRKCNRQSLNIPVGGRLHFTCNILLYIIIIILLYIIILWPILGPDSKFRGANMGLTWVLSAPDGPMLAPGTMLSGPTCFQKVKPTPVARSPGSFASTKLEVRIARQDPGVPWRCHGMQNLSTLLYLCEGTDGFTSQNSIPQIWYFADVSLNNLLSKQ